MSEQSGSGEKSIAAVRADLEKVIEHVAIIKQTFDSFGPDEPGQHNTSTLGKRIQTVLMDSNETVEAFRKRSGLSESDMQNIFGGAFQAPSTPKLLKGLNSLQGALAQRQNRISVAWVSVQSPEARKRAEKARKALEQLLDDLKASNEAGAEGSGITEAQRAQLIVLATALIAELRGPFVDRGRLNSILRWIKKIAMRAATKAIVNKVTGGIALAIDGLGHLSSLVSDEPSFDIPDDTDFSADV
jgi:hypothetical protein